MGQQGGCAYATAGSRAPFLAPAYVLEETKVVVVRRPCLRRIAQKRTACRELGHIEFGEECFLGALMWRKERHEETISTKAFAFVSNG